MRAKIIEVLAHLSEPTLARLAPCHPFFGKARIFRTAWQSLGVNLSETESKVSDHGIFLYLHKMFAPKLPLALCMDNSSELSEMDSFKEILPGLLGSHHSLFAETTSLSDFSFLSQLNDDFFALMIDQLSHADNTRSYLNRVLGQGRAIVNGECTIKLPQDSRLAYIKSQLTHDNELLWAALELVEPIGTVACESLQTKFPQLCSSSQENFLPRYYYSKIESKYGVKAETVFYLGDPSSEQNSALIQVSSSYEVYLKVNRPEPLLVFDSDSPRDITLKLSEPGEFVLRMFPPAISVLEVPHHLQFVQELEV
ncbi:MAG: hypothetical protein K0S08_2045 [Gammaproteobacteria bacterium]|jgi:hypothetical protein|nr:hypothetical protein [Gammaproteobacteria bacterium]